MNKNFIDLTGQRFGKLTAIKKMPKPAYVKRNRNYWLCQCDCGGIKIIAGNSLKNGDTKSCGCLRKNAYQRINKEIEIGQKIGRLTVIEKSERPKSSKWIELSWLCICECGNKKIIKGSSLRRGSTRSCGCLYKDKIKDLTGLKFNRLTVIRRADDYISPAGDKCVSWLCKCDCGNETIARSTALKRGGTRSCGCYGKERKASLKMLPKYESSMNKLYYIYISRAKKKKIEFYLTREQFFNFTKQKCFYCGIEPYQENSKDSRCNGKYVYNGIDRIDSNKGYSIDNCVTSCGRCNRGKYTMSTEEFSNWIKSVYNHMILNTIEI